MVEDYWHIILEITRMI
ncbi:hypothetical protein Gotri_025802 [Gossypium trilobum]|uniref:Uncharacterized protein n=1 Tax=Gossypium trilobum TaxID=34281 RepID=A0A7J9FH21_9ROSI|nr:hypothetical protein [Gossypium trilobum]